MKGSASLAIGRSYENGHKGSAEVPSSLLPVRLNACVRPLCRVKEQNEDRQKDEQKRVGQEREAKRSEYEQCKFIDRPLTSVPLGLNVGQRFLFLQS